MSRALYINEGETYMTTERIELKNGKFFIDTWVEVDSVTGVGYWERRFDSFVVTNGWTCFISPLGKLICECSSLHSDGEHTVRYVIKPNGFALLTYTSPLGEVRTLKRGFVIPKGRRYLPIEGIIRQAFRWKRESLIRLFR